MSVIKQISTGIDVFTPTELEKLNAAKINTTGRYLLCCVASADRPVDLTDLCAYTGFDREGIRKHMIKLEHAGVIAAAREYKKETLYSAVF